MTAFAWNWEVLDCATESLLHWETSLLLPLVSFVVARSRCSLVEAGPKVYAHLPLRHQADAPFSPSALRTHAAVSFTTKLLVVLMVLPFSTESGKCRVLHGDLHAFLLPGMLVSGSMPPSRSAAHTVVSASMLGSVDYICSFFMFSPLFLLCLRRHSSRWATEAVVKKCCSKY